MNRWLLKTSLDSEFLTGRFNDLLLIPSALPWVLWIQDLLGWRAQGAYPSTGEIAGHLVVWSAIAEGLMPMMSHRFTADPMDVVAYSLGAVLAHAFWTGEAAWFGRTGFDRLAPFYDAMENVLTGRLMMRVRMAFFEHWPEEGRVLLVGEGHGRFLESLRYARPRLSITYLDSSPDMLAIARRKLKCAGLTEENVTMVCADFRTWQPQKYDVICTQFFLDCFHGGELREVVKKLAGSATPTARWFLADFQVPPKGFARLRARAIVSMMYGFFRPAGGIVATRLESPSLLLQQQGFTCKFRQEWSLGLLYASWLVRDHTSPGRSNAHSADDLRLAGREGSSPRGPCHK